MSDDLAFETVDVESALFSDYRRVQATVFLGPLPTDQDLERVRRTADRATRRVAALDRHRIVGTYASWDSHVTAPGGRLVAADAVSGVTVLPTHRRRGVLTRMIVPDLAAAASRGVPVAILIAAEAPIYGRFGFGAATETARWTVDLRAATLAPQVVQEGSVELLPEPEVRPLAPAVFEAARRPGAIDHNDRWWDRTVRPGRGARPQAAHLARPPRRRRDTGRVRRLPRRGILGRSGGPHRRARRALPGRDAGCVRRAVVGADVARPRRPR